ncbi:helix-turn-helix domain-containing protein [Natrarchaeobaculum sulfurireducens]|uniref:hypothetical protein n=1 Tax=Natrarchaeobaculum sulfurireducens TaxID=2044521 RepID=UPI000E3E6669|nr:hypothetical protein [Natrarchaeobaculum sulfurireducens]
MPERDDKGRFTPEKEDTGPDAVYDSMETGEPVSTREVADNLEIPRRSALRYLDSLAEEGEIRKKKLDQRRAVWIKTE